VWKLGGLRVRAGASGWAASPWAGAFLTLTHARGWLFLVGVRVPLPLRPLTTADPAHAHHRLPHKLNSNKPRPLCHKTQMLGTGMSHKLANRTALRPPRLVDNGLLVLPSLCSSLAVLLAVRIAVLLASVLLLVDDAPTTHAATPLQARHARHTHAHPPEPDDQRA
jgi:hypothetical protein